MRIDPRHLGHLLAIAEQGTFRKAAAMLGISQPALSMSIAELERQVGAPVLDRSRRGTTLNELGEVIARRAREHRALLRDTVEEVRQKQLGLDGPLAIGITPSMTNLMAHAIADSIADRPTGIINVLAALELQLLAGLVAGDLDFILGPLPEEPAVPASILEEPLLVDPIVVLVSPLNPVAQRESVRLEELGHMLWLVPQQASPFHDLMASLFQAAGLPWPRRAIRTNALGLGEALISRLDAVMIGSRLHLSPGSPACVVPLHGVAGRRVGLRYRRISQPTPSAATLMDALRRIAGAHGLRDPAGPHG